MGQVPFYRLGQVKYLIHSYILQLSSSTFPPKKFSVTHIGQESMVLNNHDPMQCGAAIRSPHLLRQMLQVSKVNQVNQVKS